MGDDVIDVEAQKMTALAVRVESAQESVLALPVADMLPVLQEFTDRRATFKKWLLKQFTEGKHYGFPPGCEAKYSPEGELLVYTKGGEKPYPLTQWRPRPTLYKAGVKLACDLFNLVAVIEYDAVTHEMFGKPPGVICLRCTMYHKADVGHAAPLGSGRGVSDLATTQRGDRHAALLKAETRAERDALYDAKPILADLFGSEAKDGDESDSKVSNGTNGGTKAEDNAPAGPVDRKTFFYHVKAYIARRKVADALDATALIGIAVSDVLGKPKAETLKELAEVEAAITSGIYDLSTGNKIPEEPDDAGEPQSEPGENG